MAEQAWRIFNSAKEDLMNGAIILLTDTINLTLHTSAAGLTAALLDSITSIGSVGNEVASTSGYSSSGTAIQGATWATGASGSERRFDFNDVVVTALGQTIQNIKFAVLANGTGELLAYSRLSTVEYDVTTGNTHTITIASGGVFELNSA